MEFKKMDEIQKRILMEVADLHSVPEGAFNIRSDGQLAGRASSANIEIVSKEDGSGIDIHIKDGTKNESVHIPVIMSKSGLHDVVYNDFYVGENCDVIIVAGCGISNCGGMDSEHDGIHRFFVGRNSKVRYVEKHYGEGDGTGKRILNPVTEVYMQEGSNVEMEMVQIKGVDSTDRRTIAKVAENASLVPLKIGKMKRGTAELSKSVQRIGSRAERLGKWMGPLELSTIALDLGVKF